MIRNLLLAALLALAPCAYAGDAVEQPGIGDVPPPIAMKDRKGNPVDLEALKTPAFDWERWLRDHFVAKVPGEEE